MLKHGSETLVKDFGTNYIVKTPLSRATSKRREWMTGQRVAADTMKHLSEISGGAYIVPKTEFIDVENCRVIEERIDGMPLTPLLFRTLDDDKRRAVIDALAKFYADIHTIHPVQNSIKYKMHYGFRINYLSDFIKNGMRKWFPMSDVRFVANAYRDLNSTEYETRLVWTHNDLFEENILYNTRKNKCAIIDFTRAGYSFLHYDILDSYAGDLNMFDDFRTQYIKYCGADNLPDNLADDEKWKKILNYHRAAQLLTDMDDNVMDLCIMQNFSGAVEKLRNNVSALRQVWTR